MQRDYFLRRGGTGRRTIPVFGVDEEDSTNPTIVKQLGQPDSIYDRDFKLPVTRHRGQYIWKRKLKKKQDELPGRIRAIERPIDNFNFILNKTTKLV